MLPVQPGFVPAACCAHLAASEEKSGLSDTIQSTAIAPTPPPPLLFCAACWLPLLVMPPPLLLLGVTRVQMMTPSGSGSKLPTPWRKAAGSGGGSSGGQSAGGGGGGKRIGWG